MCYNRQNSTVGDFAEAAPLFRETPVRRDAVAPLVGAWIEIASVGVDGETSESF